MRALEIDPNTVPVKQDGTPDERFRPRRRAREELMGRRWRLIRKGETTNALSSVTGQRLRRYFAELEDLDTGRRIVCGLGEAREYAGVDG